MNSIETMGHEILLMPKSQNTDWKLNENFQETTIHAVKEYSSRRRQSPEAFLLERLMDSIEIEEDIKNICLQAEDDLNFLKQMDGLYTNDN